MKKHFQINNFKIGKNHPTFIIAEAGINHNGSLKLAKQMFANMCVCRKTKEDRAAVSSRMPRDSFCPKSTKRSNVVFGKFAVPSRQGKLPIPA